MTVRFSKALAIGGSPPAAIEIRLGQQLAGLAGTSGRPAQQPQPASSARYAACLCRRRLRRRRRRRRVGKWKTAISLEQFSGGDAACTGSGQPRSPPNGVQFSPAGHNMSAHRRADERTRAAVRGRLGQRTDRRARRGTRRGTRRRAARQLEKACACAAPLRPEKPACSRRCPCFMRTAFSGELAARQTELLAGKRAAVIHTHTLTELACWLRRRLINYTFATYCIAGELVAATNAKRSSSPPLARSGSILCRRRRRLGRRCRVFHIAAYLTACAGAAPYISVSFSCTNGARAYTLLINRPVVSDIL